ncbi:MAG: DUF4923 family protein [Muribaculaceae bacterium]|nr:DUF4923 family protein [Muribaculaceae bacterium]MDE7111657.1 DUF4923 family protein [Muribaculaceae bacterium]
MKRLIIAAALCVSLSACASNPLGSLLGGGNSSSTEQSGSKGGSLSDIIGGVVGGLLTTDKVDTDKMVGTWSYSSPAVCFKSENFLQKAGGSAIAATLEGKLAPYYKTAGLNKLVLTINEDKSFVMQSGKITVRGTVETDGEGEVYFNFKALGTIPAGKMKAYITMTAGKQMSLMFDVTKLVSIIKMVGSVSGSTAIKGVSSILDSYDGICAGFKLNKK